MVSTTHRERSEYNRPRWRIGLKSIATSARVAIVVSVILSVSNGREAGRGSCLSVSSVAMPRSG